MNIAKFYELMDEVLDLDEGTIKGDEVLESLEWESITIVSFIALVDEAFDIILEGEKVIACKTIEDLLKMVEKNSLVQER